MIKSLGQQSQFQNKYFTKLLTWRSWSLRIAPKSYSKISFPFSVFGDPLLRFQSPRGPCFTFEFSIWITIIPVLTFEQKVVVCHIFLDHDMEA